MSQSNPLPFNSHSKEGCCDIINWKCLFHYNPLEDVCPIIYLRVNKCRSFPWSGPPQCVGTTNSWYDQFGFTYSFVDIRCQYSNGKVLCKVIDR